MGREVRRVPENWEHPKETKFTARGYREVHKPLLGYDYEECLNEWLEGRQKWAEGLQRPWKDEPWEPKKDYHEGTWEEYNGDAPQASDYMPSWPESERTHWQMYETISEGTPISPVMESPESLARWLADNEANACAGDTATYEEWLRMIVGPGWAPSLVSCGGVLMSGVAGLPSKEDE